MFFLTTQNKYGKVCHKPKMNYKKLLHTQYERFKIRNWNTLYFVIDVHEVILKPNYETDYAEEYYPLAKEVLQTLSNRPEIVMIMWTASVHKHREQYMEKFKNDGINFKFHNENPDVAGTTAWGDYESKMYCNVGMDDKFLFDPFIHWQEIREFYNQKDADMLQLKFNF